MGIEDSSMFVAYSRDKVYKDVGNTRQLFIDDDVVAVVKNVTRRQHTPRKHPANPIYKNDKPWEVVTYFRTSNFSVVRDPLDGLFKCWVQDFHDYFTVPGVPYERSRIYYAQSEDGLNWEKPALGLHDVDGHNTNTIIVSPDATGKSTICPNMIIDPVETDPARRFKMVHLEITNGERHGLCMSFSPDGISWTPYEGNPIMVKTEPWEKDAPHPCKIFYDEEDGIWKMWYLGLKDHITHQYFLMYATSEDGIEWVKPKLGLVKDAAGNDTNMIIDGKFTTVYKDLEADPSRRYKMGGSRRTDGVQHPTLYHSPDGFHWTPDPGPFSDTRGDENFGFMYDPESKKFLAFCRNVYPKPMLVHRVERRVYRMQSNDLLHWTMSEPVIQKDELDPPDTDFYGLGCMFYESIYVGFVSVHQTAIDDFQTWLAFSKDSFNWHRLRSRPFLPLGPEGSWEWGMVGCGPPHRVGDELRFYYSGRDGLHDQQGKNTGIGIANLRLDGFVSMDTFENKHRTKNYPPTLMTKPLYSPGNRLVVNADARDGFIDAELLDVDGYPIEGYSKEDCDTFEGDSLAHTFSWKGNPDIGRLLPARVRFTLNNTKLYALQIPKA